MPLHISCNPRSYIKDAIAYCKQHGLVKNSGLHYVFNRTYFPKYSFDEKYVFPSNPRNDKYSAKVKKYFVEYSDKESNKKTNTEIEKSKTKTEAPCIMYQTLPNIFVRCVCLQFYTQRKKMQLAWGLPCQGDEVQLSNQWLSKQPTAVAKEGKAQSPHEGDLCLLQSGPPGGSQVVHLIRGAKVNICSMSFITCVYFNLMIDMYFVW